MTDTTEAPVGDARARRGMPPALEWTLLIVLAISVAFVCQRVLVQAFYIPSTSMVPTLQVGDRVLVNKLSYKLHDVRRGDVVVFEAPKSQQTEGIKDFVKRVIGLPGETVEFRDGDVFIDGKRLDEPYLPARAPGNTLPQAIPPPGCQSNTTKPYVSCTVPDDSVFVMGDNRTASKDARTFGPIEQNMIVGRVFVTVWPPDRNWIVVGAILAGIFLLIWVVRRLRR